MNEASVRIRAANQTSSRWSVMRGASRRARLLCSSSSAADVPTRKLLAMLSSSNKSRRKQIEVGASSCIVGLAGNQPPTFPVGPFGGIDVDW